MPTRRRRRRGLAPAHAAARRKAREELAEQDRALQQWLALQLDGDAVTAHLVWWVGTLHAGVVAWTAAAIDAHVLPAGGGTASVSGTAEPDRAMLRALAPNPDAEDLEHVSGLVLGKLEMLAGWYTTQLDAVGTFEPWAELATIRYLAAWTLDPVAVLIGGQQLAPTLERCIRQHGALKAAGDPARRKAAEKRWRDLAKWYVRLLDGRNIR